MRVADVYKRQDLCYAANPASHVYFVPAFTGLGAPHWASDDEGCVFGMTRTTGRAEFVKAVSYTHLDVYKRQVRMGAREDQRADVSLLVDDDQRAGAEMCIRDRS